MKLSQNAADLLNRRYCSHGEQANEIFPRVAKSLGRMLNGKDRTKEYLEMMENLDFLPNSPCLFNAGYSDQLKACFVMPVHDSMDSIFGTLQQSATIFKTGGGVGYNFSEIREKGAPLHHGGTSSGALSFIRIYDAITEAVKQGGRRRGASMGIMDYNHPEIIDFIQAKGKHGQLTNFNVSILADDNFMKKISTDDEIALKSRFDKRKTVRTIKARDIFWLAITYAWENGDPGMLFQDRINKDNPYSERLNACNPCGEQFLFPYESCCLGSINLAHCVTADGALDRDKLVRLTESGTHFLMATNKRCKFPVAECYMAQSKYLRIGLGIMGFADMLMAMNIKYDSAEALKTIDKVGRILQNSHKYAPQSASTLSIAPTGSLSIIANCSSGIEPIFAANYTRNVVAGTFAESRNSEYLRTAHDVIPEWHLKVQARFQRWIDNGISKTVNMPRNASQSDVANIYKQAWKMGCKGVTVFRDGCRGDDQVYKTTPKCDGESCSL